MKLFFIIININYKKSEEKVKQIWSLYSFPKNSENVLCVFKKRKAWNTFSFKVYGRILIELKYYETDELEFKIKPRPLDIKFKQKFREHLNKDKKTDVIEYNNIKLYKNE